MRCLLFNPWVTDFAAFDLWSRPLNLLRLSTLLKQSGCDVLFYDCMDRLSSDLEGIAPKRKHRTSAYGCGHYYQEEIPRPDCFDFIPRPYKRFGVPPDRVEQSLLKLPEPEVVIIPCMMTYWYIGVFEAISMIRRIYPNARVVLGGTYARLCREHAEANSGADLILSGKHWPDIISKLFKFMGDSDKKCVGDQSLWIDPDYALLANHTSFPLLTSTGCPCHCTYCATHALWPKHIHYKVDDVWNTLERAVKQYGATDITFFDDALLLDKDSYFLPLMERVVQSGLSVRFHTPNAVHVRQVDDETAILLKQAGFKTLRLGLETNHPELQATTGAKVENSDYEQAMQSLNCAGFSAREIGTYLLLGLPGQSLEMVRDSAAFALSLGSEVKLAMYSPVPGTRLFKEDFPDYRINPAYDPLVQNNSITPWRSTVFDHESYQGLKSFVAQGNSVVRNKSSQT